MIVVRAIIIVHLVHLVGHLKQATPRYITSQILDWVLEPLNILNYGILKFGGIHTLSTQAG